jgi:hypothetical protein
MPTTAPMTCPWCGIDMNMHAEKIEYLDTPESPGYDPDLGGVLEEIHGCPECGATQTRPCVSDE